MFKINGAEINNMGACKSTTKPANQVDKRQTHKHLEPTALNQGADVQDDRFVTKNAHLNTHFDEPHVYPEIRQNLNAVEQVVEVHMNVLPSKTNEKMMAYLQDDPFGSRSNYGVSFEAGNAGDRSLRFAEDWLKEIKRIVEMEIKAREEHLHIFG